MAAKKSTAVVKWDEELAEEARIAAGMEANAGGGQFFSTKSGVLSWQDAPLQDNQMGVIILDSILENVFYEGEYDPETPMSPTCFAFGRDEKTMGPYKTVVEAKNDQCGASGLCSGCPMNEWGTAEKGKGKACRNTRRLAMIPAGTYKNGKFELFDDEDMFKTSVIGFMKLPVTSVKGYASFVKQVSGTLNRPPYGIVTKVKVVPDPKNQFRVLFEPVMTVPDELLGMVTTRKNEAKNVIEFPYQLNEDGPPAKKSKKPEVRKGRKY